MAVLIQGKAVEDARRIQKQYGSDTKFLFREVPEKSEQGGGPVSYRIEILIIEEEEGGYSTVALNLPGAGSCGKDKEESIANAKDAIKDALETYQELGDPIPWAEVTPDKLVGGERKVIWIDV